jgi:hypothetical protein
VKLADLESLRLSDQRSLTSASGEACLQANLGRAVDVGIMLSDVPNELASIPLGLEWVLPPPSRVRMQSIPNPWTQRNHATTTETVESPVR